MIPLIIAAGVGVAAIIAAAAGAAAYSNLRKNTESKSVVLVGPRYSGKTTFFSFLTSPTKVDASSYSPTQSTSVAPLDAEALKRARWHELQLNLVSVEITDLPGDSEKWGAWHQAAANSHAVCFIANINEMRKDERIATEARRGAQQVAAWRAEATVPPALMLILTHSDLEWAGADEILKRTEIVALRRALTVHVEDTFVVNLLNEADCQTAGLRLIELLVGAG